MTLIPKALTKEAFAPFGDIIDCDPDKAVEINWGMTQRYHGLGRVEAVDSDEGERGSVALNIFRGTPIDLPYQIRMVERHPLGSQAFVPMFQGRFLIVVADPVDAPGPEHLHAFIAAAGQGINYHRNTWHHPLLAIEDGTDFLVVDRVGEGNNLEESWFEDRAVPLVLA